MVVEENVNCQITKKKERERNDEISGEMEEYTETDALVRSGNN
jgi:hypothetical protein